MKADDTNFIYWWWVELRLKFMVIFKVRVMDKFMVMVMGRVRVSVMVRLEVMVMDGVAMIPISNKGTT